MPPLHRTLSFQISKAFTGMRNENTTKNKHSYYIEDGTSNEPNECWLHKTLTKSFSFDFPKNGEVHKRANRTHTLPKRFGEIYHSVSYYK